MLDKKYNHIEVEENKYETWIKKELFKCGNLSKEPFCIVIPPPNVTGNLHLGHAWDTSIQDIIIRYKRMQGYDTLWLPGMDHAGIATQAKIDAKLKQEGINPREMSRDEWLKQAWEWKTTYADNIRKQWAKLGLSLDYSKERFTLDEGLNNAVTKVFIDLYDKGLIYKGERIINWDPEAKTALSNEEVIHKEVKGHFYYIKYYIENSNDYLEIATTRPETLFGDTAVAVNPNDDRYKNLIGKNVILPVVNKLIKVISDEYADIEFGTGVVKITPAHDPNDFEVGNRHNLERVICINTDGTMNEKAGKYNGLDRFECRKQLVEDLKKDNLLIKVEEINHSVGFSERTDVMIEPYLSKQWFVKMRPLADRVLNNQKDKDTKVNFIPNRFEKIMNHWMTITYDWCISRQLWWGHRIPAWYKGDEIYVGYEAPKEDGWVQDEDVLDTWFSSALWPFSTLGWPNNTSDLNRYFPNNILITGYDIIPFWVNRMTFQSLEFTNKRPFKECLIHGLIRDKQGRKMSKSLGNGIDPMDIIKDYGADSLRYFLTTNVASGQDLRYDEEKVKSTWNYINKIWNASRYVLMNTSDITEYNFNNLSDIDKWILTKLNITVKDVTKHMDKYEFNLVANTLYSFVWNDFCDNYIELSKHNQNDTTKSVLLKVLTDIIKMLHPFMPYVTEEIYSKLNIKESNYISISNYPIYDKSNIYNEETTNVDNMIEFIKIFRNTKSKLNISKDYNIKLLDNKLNSILIKILKLDDKLIKEDLNKKQVSIEYKDFKLTIYYDDSNNSNLESKETEKLILSIERRTNLLNNKNYVDKAPKEIIEKEKELLEQEKKKFDNINKNK